MDMSERKKFITLRTEPFGSYFDEEHEKEYQVTQYIWRTCQTEVRMIDYGATLTSVLHPDMHGESVDIVLGYDNIEDYRSSTNPYMGATVGRVANRITGGRFKLGCLSYKINSQSEDYALHGGVRGFDKEMWKAVINDNYVTFCHISEDGDQGFPGRLTVLLHCILVNEHKFIMRFEARTTKPTIINLTNHAYFNLAGHEKGPEALYNHVLQIRALRITETNEKSLPTGKFVDVKDTPFDFIQMKRIGDVIHKTPYDGFDNNFCIEHVPNLQPDDLTYILTLCDLVSKRRLEIRCDQPGVQVYTSNYYPALTEEGMRGKGGARYYRHGAIALEPQNYPDAINNPHFPTSILNPGEVYTKTIQYIFGVDHVV